MLAARVSNPRSRVRPRAAARAVALLVTLREAREVCPATGCAAVAVAGISTAQKATTTAQISWRRRRHPPVSFMIDLLVRRS